MGRCRAKPAGVGGAASACVHLCAHTCAVGAPLPWLHSQVLDSNEPQLCHKELRALEPAS